MIQKKVLQAGLWAAVAGAGLLGSVGAASGAGVDMYDGQWHYSLTPYAWFPNIYQKLQLNTPSGGGKTVEVEVKPDSYLSDLEFALMGTFEARKGDWPWRWIWSTTILAASRARSKPCVDQGATSRCRSM